VKVRVVVVLTAYRRYGNKCPTLERMPRVRLSLFVGQTENDIRPNCHASAFGGSLVRGTVLETGRSRNAPFSERAVLGTRRSLEIRSQIGSQIGSKIGSQIVAPLWISDRSRSELFIGSQIGTGRFSEWLRRDLPPSGLNPAHFFSVDRCIILHESSYTSLHKESV